MLALVKNSETVLAAVRGLDLGRTLDAGGAGNFLINVPDVGMSVMTRHVGRDPVTTRSDVVDG
jgi:hypothetical protein